MPRARVGVSAVHGDSWFASAARAGAEALERAAHAASANPVIDAALQLFDGLLVVLNAERQVVALNTAMLRAMGVDDPDTALGLRLGEALHCKNVTGAPSGCGTSVACRACGAVLAMLASLETNRPASDRCALRCAVNGSFFDRLFLVRAVPLEAGSEQLLLVFLRDVTESQRREEADRSFFHDLRNTIHALLGAAMLAQTESGPGAREAADVVVRLAERLSRELDVHDALLRGAAGRLRAQAEALDAVELLGELRTFFSAHPAAAGRRLEIESPTEGSGLHTDRSLALRVLTNMILNALEATAEGGTVRAWVDADERRITFSVWNPDAIAPEIAARIFQRHVTTKSGLGRGTGTHAMKLLGELALGGRVGFETSPTEGTRFWLDLGR